ncbi:MAG TPA: cytochrome P450 [Humisphaera sp.]|jgi:hypothetical protein|nr:cytochrome P450 [Humisphaera sp.]
MPQMSWNRFAPRLRKVVFSAIDETRQRGSTEVDADDLLLGALRDLQSAAVFVLDHSGVSVGQLQDEIRKLFTANDNANGHSWRLSPAALRVLQQAEEESRTLSHGHVGTEHLLLSLTRVSAGAAGRALDRLGITHEAALRGLRAWQSASMARRAAVAQPARLPRALGRAFEKYLRPATRKLQMAYKVFIRKSIGHPGFATNPYPLYRALRREGPVRRDPMMPVWIVNGYEQVQTVLRDPRFCRDPFSGDNLPDSMRQELRVDEDSNGSASTAEISKMQLLFLDPPRHTRLRGLFARAFTPRVVQGLRPRIHQITHELLNRVQAKGQMDLIADLAYPLPTMVIAEMLGFPPEDYEKLKKWSDDFAALVGLNPSAEQQFRAGESIEQMHEYFKPIVARLRFRPEQNLMSDLLAADEAGDRLGDLELFANCILLLAAGHETTTNLIGNGIMALLQNPKQLQLLRSDPTLMGPAIEELLRFDSPVQWASRVAREEIELGGKRIAAGDFVLASLGAANRDPNRFDRPDVLDIRRADNKHLAFGQGIHFCLGAALARMTDRHRGNPRPTEKSATFGQFPVEVE